MNPINNKSIKILHSVVINYAVLFWLLQSNMFFNLTTQNRIKKLYYLKKLNLNFILICLKR